MTKLQTAHSHRVQPTTSSRTGPTALMLAGTMAADVPIATAGIDRLSGRRHNDVRLREKEPLRRVER